MTLKYRYANLDDLDDLDDLVRMRIRDLQMFSTRPASEGIEHFIREFYKKKIQENACHTLLAYAGGEVAATATIYYYDVMPSNENPRGRVGQITNVWVDESFRRQGIATAMLRQLMDRAGDEAGMVCLNSSEAALGMYKAMGFMEKHNYLVYYMADPGSRNKI